MLTNFNNQQFKPRKDYYKLDKNNEKIEKVKIKSYISWGELILLIVVGMLFIFALTERIIYEDNNEVISDRV